jgi:Flp pilus assembly CpaE family ATPase
MTSKPRIFVADDNAAGLDYFRVLAEKEGWQFTGYATDLESFLNRALMSDADVLLVSSVFLAVMGERDRRSLRAENPGRVIIALTETDDFHELKAAVRAGARDCFNVNGPTELIASLIYEYYTESATNRNLFAGQADMVIGPEKPKIESPAGARVAAFCGADGGTGKSFLALQAAAMAVVHAGAKTCLVDFDLLCGTLSGIVGEAAPGDRTMADLAEVIEEIKPTHIESLIREHSGGFSMVCGPAPGLVGAAGLADAVLGPLRETFDAIIVDLPSNPPPDLLSKFIGVFFVVVNPDTASAKSARPMVSMIESRGLDTEIAAIVNRSDRMDSLKTAEIARLSGLDIAAEIPEDDGAGRLFDLKGKVLANSPGLAVIRGLVPAVQRIKDFEELIRPKRFSMPEEWRPPWAVTRDA